MLKDHFSSVPAVKRIFYKIVLMVRLAFFALETAGKEAGPFLPKGRKILLVEPWNVPRNDQFDTVNLWIKKFKIICIKFLLHLFSLALKALFRISRIVLIRICSCWPELARLKKFHKHMVRLYLSDSMALLVWPVVLLTIWPINIWANELDGETI